MAQHLVVFYPKQLEAILSGSRVVDVRFSQHRVLPYEGVAKEDEILLKAPGGMIFGSIKVDNVLFYDHLDGEAVGKLRREYAQDLGVDETFWERKKNARYASIIFLKGPRRFVAPMKSPGKHDRRPWVVL